MVSNGWALSFVTDHPATTRPMKRPRARPRPGCGRARSSRRGTGAPATRRRPFSAPPSRRRMRTHDPAGIGLRIGRALARLHHQGQRQPFRRMHLSPADQPLVCEDRDEDQQGHALVLLGRRGRSRRLPRDQTLAPQPRRATFRGLTWRSAGCDRHQWRATPDQAEASAAGSARLADRAARRHRLRRHRLSGAAVVLDPLRTSERPRQFADGDADRAGHSRRSDQCRPGRRHQGRGLRDARGRLVSGRSDHAEIIDRDRRQRAARPPLQGRAGQQSLLSRPPRGSRLRKADRGQRRSPQSCPVLEGAGPGRGEAPGLARRGDARSRRRRQQIYRRRDPPYQPRSRRRARGARGRPGKRRHGRREISGDRHWADDRRPQWRRRPLLHRRRDLGAAAGRGLQEARRARG